MLLKNKNFLDKFFNFFEDILDETNILELVIKHININEFEKKIAREKKILDNPPKKRWKRIKKENIYNNLCINRK